MNTYIYLSLPVIAEYVPYKCIHCTWMHVYVCVLVCTRVFTRVDICTRGHVYNRSGDTADTHNLLPQSVP